MKTQPDAFTKFLWAMKSCKDERGVPTGANLNEYQRKIFKECFEMSYAEFDEAWRAWAMVNYKPLPPGKDPGAPSGLVPVGGGRWGVGGGDGG
jgi:hypothetical protein